MQKTLLLLLMMFSQVCRSQNLQFYGTMSRQLLESYLDRTMVTEFDSLHKGMLEYDDLINFAIKSNTRIMHTCFGVGYGSEAPINHGYFENVATIVNDINAAYGANGMVRPIVGAAIWERITHDVDSIWMDDEVANTYHVRKRRFNYEHIKYIDDTNSWRAAPDITRLETQMYFYYLAHRFIDCGIESLHMGILSDEDKNDSSHTATWDLYSKIRKYASSKNRGLVLIHADSYGPHLRNSDTLLLDYNNSPSRVSGYYSEKDSTWASMWNYRESGTAGPGRLGYTDCSPYGKMSGGRTYFGWYADTALYQVTLDNTLTNNCNCLVHAGCYTVYGYDEISWFTLQSADYRNKWLCYANSTVKKLDRNCHFIMPGRTLFTRRWTYYSAMNGYGYDQEDAILAAWNGTATECDPNDELNLASLWGNNSDGKPSLVVYPNPVTDVANIVFDSQKGDKVTIKIVDFLGRVLLDINTNKNRDYFTWNTENLPSGVYFCTASVDGKQVSGFRITVLKQ